jgi:hypothetical protein
MKVLLTQFITIIILSIVAAILRRVFYRFWPKPIHYFDFWPPVLLWFSYQNISIIWFAYVILIWSVITVSIVIYQWRHYHEFIYKRFVPVFWRLTLLYTAVAYMFSVGLKILG